MRIAVTLLALALSTTACKKKEAQPTGGTAGSATTPATGSATDPGPGSGTAMGSDTAAPTGSGAGSAEGSAAGSGDAPTMSKRAGNCPSTVLGATTKAEAKGKDVVITISSTDKDAIAAIQKRTAELLADKQGKASGGAGHDQKGTHGGGTGMCPVYLPDGATAKAANDKTGVAITITPKDKPEDLQKEVAARIAKSDEWVKANIKPGDKGNQGGVGGGKGDHGANHSGEGDSKGKDRKGDGKGGGEGKGGGGGKGTGGGGGAGGSGSGSAK